MKALYYQCSSGISGDMNLGALVDLGVPRDHLVRELGRLALAGEYTLDFEHAEKMGIRGTRATVHLTAAAAAPAGVAAHTHGHTHDHTHDHARDHAHSHTHFHAHDSLHGDPSGTAHGAHAHRHWPDIRRLIVAAGYSPRVQAVALDIFSVLAAAEAKVHEVPVDEVQFHEVGAVDSIVDIVGAAIALDYLDVSTVLCSTVELGSGFVRCAHGLMPVPAPATIELLQGVPCHLGGVDGEATTPTGAAILKATVQRFEPPVAFVPSRVAYGIGQRDFKVPNVLRVMLGELTEPTAVKAAPQPTSFEIKANIDDMTPESYEPMMEALFQAGAADVFLTSIVMKKNRPAQMVSVLCNEQRLDTLVQTLFEHSTTIGVRIQPAFKRMMSRQQYQVDTPYGPVRVKVVDLSSEHATSASRWKVEHDDIKRMASEHGKAYLALRREIEAVVQQRLPALQAQQRGESP